MSIARLLSIGLVLAACSGDKAPAGGPPKRPPAPVTTTVVTKADVPVDVDAIGHVEASQTVAISSRIGGQLVEVHFKEGEVVSAGQVLFTIDPRPYQIALDAAKARLARDQAIARNAGRNLARQDALAASNIASKAELDTASTSASSARATIAADQADVANAELQLSYCVITAPITGRTGALLVHAGNLVRANDTQPLVTIRQTDPARVVVSIPERYLPRLRLRIGDPQPLELEATPEGDHAVASKGTLALVDNSVDATTGTVPIFGTFPNADNNLWPGQFVKVRVRLAIDKDQVVVAARAVQDGQNGNFVYLVVDKKAKMQPVTVARIQDDVAIIASGLTPGQVVVSDGHMRLAPGADVVVTPPKDASAGPDASGQPMTVRAAP
ncbi:MAG: efflux RND transporter periplasmic adaptor subunit [Myxococcota bacterium]